MVNAHVIIAHYNEDLTWVNNLNYPYTVISKNGLPQDTLTNKGFEASSYLKYIIDNYDNLAEFNIFVHGHRNAWHMIENIDEKINRLEFIKDYCNINDKVNKQIVYNKNEVNRKHIITVVNKISEVLGEPIEIDKILFNQAAQFYVCKNNILRNKKETYVELFNFLMETDIYSFATSRGFEYTWHIIFTGNHKDPS
jgi:Protein of unknown function (DUF3431)